MKWYPYLTGLVIASGLYAQEAGPYVPGHLFKGDYTAFSQDFIEYHCFDCHGDGSDKGDFNMDDLGLPDESNAETWKSIWAQVALNEMPPKDKEQPSALEKIQFTDGVIHELEKVMKDKGGFHAHLKPKRGNFIDHNLLFGKLPKGVKLEPTSSPKKLWRVTPSEHLTRLNELINTEPNFDPNKPGYRTRGDAVPLNHGGELKLYYGLDHITKWAGGDTSYMTAIKSTPGVLSSAHTHGFENYPDHYTVNSSETIQILEKAKHIIKYMAYGQSSLVSTPDQITNDAATYELTRKKTDDRGLPSTLTYDDKISRPLTPVYHLLKDSEQHINEKNLKAAIAFLFEALTFRPAAEWEIEKYYHVVEKSIAQLGVKEGTITGLSALFLDRDALFRSELGEGLTPDPHGRVMLQDWELGLALNHALSYIPPDTTLRKAIADGKMRTREDVKREVIRMLNDESIRKPRVLQFFREYFDYDLAGYKCKDEEAMQRAGVVHRNRHYTKAMFGASASTDRLVELILKEDKQVLKNLLTTQKVVVSQEDTIFYGRMRTLEEIEKAEEVSAQWRKEIKATQEKFEQARTSKKDVYKKFDTENTSRDDQLKIHRELIDLGMTIQQLASDKNDIKLYLTPKVEHAKFSGEDIYARVSRPTLGLKSMRPERLLATAPKGQRLGILTTPSWLISHSDAMDNHAIHRGIWIRERLLGGGIPDVPITVDAQLPDEPGTTLRSRMRVTKKEFCWSCHDKMDPLGLTFENYNHMGIYREFEFGQPVDTSGEIIDSGDPSLDGSVANAFELIHKLAQSERVEQVFIRHAFRYWMGRNETIHDAPVLQAAHQAYRDNGGSMKALIASLVTSDAFLYRR